MSSLPPRTSREQRIRRWRSKLASRSRFRHVEAKLAPAPRFIIVGTGRCGTRYTSELLTEIGVKCTHERVYNLAGSRPQFGVTGESSWYAVPWLDTYRGVVIHQVRDPLRALSSLSSSHMWEEKRHITYISRYINLVGDPVIDSMRFLVGWNRLCEEYGVYRFRVEDVDERITDILELVAPNHRRLDLTPVESKSRNVNARPIIYRFEHYDDLPAGVDRDRVVAQAEQYGYGIR